MRVGKSPVASRAPGPPGKVGKIAIFLLQSFLHLV
jgi:hypothetical protein